MAARGLASPGAQIVDLRHLAGRELDPLLLEETVEWQRELNWDFAKSAELVRHFIDGRALTGAALVDRGEVVGYGYAILEDHKGLIGDLYVKPAWRDGVTDVRLFRTILDALILTPRLKRIESQLMLVDPAVAAALSQQRSVQIYERLLMCLDCALYSRSPGFPGRRINRRRFHFEPWADHHHEAAAGVISLAYKDHVDSRINDQYRTVPGARRFIANIVQYPGCGVFFRDGSAVAFDVETGWLAGVVLASFVSRDAGHITQLCVTPHSQGAGLGYELLHQSIAALEAAGAQTISLTVTAANTEAVELYRRCGFREVRRFSAYVWEAD